MLLITLNDWKKHLLDFANHVNGKMTIEKMPVYGDNYELYSSTINISYENNYLNILQTATKIDYVNCGVSSLTLLFLYKNKSALQVALNERDFFDKLFSGRRIKTDNPEFDQRFTINSSNKEIAKNLFVDKRIQGLFLNNRLLVFNISTSKGETTIKLKYMENRLYSIEEMTQTLADFENILKKVLK